MELKKLSKKKNELEIEITDENETIINPIIHLLLENDDVEYAACITDHPLSEKRTLYIRTKKGSPVETLKKTIKQVNNEYKKFGKKFETTKGKN